MNREPVCSVHDVLFWDVPSREFAEFWGALTWADRDALLVEALARQGLAA
jgi:hypothetical protein